MQTFLLISLAFNALLCAAMTVSVRRLLSAYRRESESSAEERLNAKMEREKLDGLLVEFGKLGTAVETSLRAIRDDMDRNYEHTHDGHVLGMLAYDLQRELQGGRGIAAGVALDQERVDSVKALGGAVANRDFMTLGELLEFGWLLHAKASARAGELCAVVAQPCDGRGHARWLGKTLAIYERICGTKELGIERMTVAVDAWRRENTLALPSLLREVL